MILKGKDGRKDEEDPEEVKEKKADEMQLRQMAMVDRTDKKRSLRLMHVKRREAEEAEKYRQARETRELKHRRNQETRRSEDELPCRKKAEEPDPTQPRRAQPSGRLLICVTDKKQGKLTKLKNQKVAEEGKAYDAWYRSDDLKKSQAEEKKRSYRRAIQNQLIENRCRLREKEEEKHRERKILEEADYVLHRENLQVEQRRLETAALQRAEREAFLKARQIWKDKRKDLLRTEHNKTAQVVADKQTMQKKEAEEKRDNRASKDAVVDNLAKMLTEEENRRREREEICRELYSAERESERAKMIEKLALKKKETARDLMREMVRHQKLADERKKKEDKIDAAFAKYLADQRRNLDEEERQKQQARREKTIQYGRELRETITRNEVERLTELRKKRMETASGNRENVGEGDAECANVRANPIARNIDGNYAREESIRLKNGEVRATCGDDVGSFKPKESPTA